MGSRFRFINRSGPSSGRSKGHTQEEWEQHKSYILEQLGDPNKKYNDIIKLLQDRQFTVKTTQFTAQLQSWGYARRSRFRPRRGNAPSRSSIQTIGEPILLSTSTVTGTRLPSSTIHPLEAQRPTIMPPHTNIPPSLLEPRSLHPLSQLPPSIPLSDPTLSPLFLPSDLLPQEEMSNPGPPCPYVSLRDIERPPTGFSAATTVEYTSIGVSGWEDSFQVTDSSVTRPDTHLEVASLRSRPSYGSIVELPLQPVPKANLVGFGGQFAPSMDMEYTRTIPNGNFSSFSNLQSEASTRNQIQPLPIRSPHLSLERFLCEHNEVAVKTYPRIHTDHESHHVNDVLFELESLSISSNDDDRSPHGSPKLV